MQNVLHQGLYLCLAVILCSSCTRLPSNAECAAAISEASLRLGILPDSTTGCLGQIGTAKIAVAMNYAGDQWSVSKAWVNDTEIAPKSLSAEIRRVAQPTDSDCRGLFPFNHSDPVASGNRCHAFVCTISVYIRVEYEQQQWKRRWAWVSNNGEIPPEAIENEIRLIVESPRFFVEKVRAKQSAFMDFLKEDDSPTSDWKFEKARKAAGQLFCEDLFGVPTPILEPFSVVPRF